MRSNSHELRNEVVEELISRLVGGSRAKLDDVLRSGYRREEWKAKRAEDEGNRGKARKTGQKAPLGEANLSEEREHNGG